MIGLINNTAQNMTVAQRALQVAAHNMSHAADDNYARQRAVVLDNGAQKHNNILIGNGVHIELITDARNTFLDNQILQVGMEAGSLNGRYEALKITERAFGEEINRQNDSAQVTSANSSNTSPSGISKSIDDLFVQSSNWAALPSNMAQKQMMVATAEALTTQINRVGAHLNQAIQDANAVLDQDAQIISNLLLKIADINSNITRLEIGAPQGALDLRGERQLAMEELGHYMNFNIAYNDLAKTSLTLTSVDASNNPVTLVDGSVSFGPVTTSGSSLQIGGTTLAISSGEVAGYQSAVMQDIPHALTGLDALASQLVISFNQAYSTTGAHFFDATRTTALTIQLDPSLTATNLKATATASAGANEIAMSFENLRLQSFSTTAGDSIDLTFNQHYSRVLNTVGNAFNNADSQSTSTQVVKNALKEERQNHIGVSYEEEMASLMSFSHLFQANLKIMDIVSNCLNELVHSLGN